jgi:hypothetical protein
MMHRWSEDTDGKFTLTEGTRYSVIFDDCCVTGKFTAVLVHIHYSADCTGEFFPYELIFDNSVVLTEWLCVKFEEV